MRLGLLSLTCLFLVGYRTLPPRNPVPRDLVDASVYPGIPGARSWGDELPDIYQSPLELPFRELKETYPAWLDTPHSYLALSGGGPMGAFGAGVLTGMSQSGKRPEFQIVTGISAGALIAPFAFLGSDYDPVLEHVFTKSDTGDILQFRGPISSLRLDAVTSSKPLKAQIDQFVDENLMRAIAAEHQKGRRLLIGTTNLDTERPVTWNLGAIAETDTPKALELIRRVLLASASIPGAFPPVQLKVRVKGVPYDELHADGGITNTIFLYPSQMDWDLYTEKLRVPEPPSLYLIQNMYVEPTWRPIERNTLPIASWGFMSMLRSQGVGDLLRIATLAERDGIQIRMAYIPSSFTEEPEEIFDPEWMSQLFQIGIDIGRNGTWKSPSLLLPESNQETKAG